MKKDKYPKPSTRDSPKDKKHPEWAYEVLADLNRNMMEDAKEDKKLEPKK
ncbi:hypothetical protein ACFL3W_01295 [Pseudomonadota bacterium]